MPRTYDPIASTTLTSTATSVTFSDIPGTYTDLVIAAYHNTSGTPTVDGPTMRLNSDSGSNYSVTRIQGNGSSAVSNRLSNQTYLWFGLESYSSSEWVTSIVQIMSYSNTNVNKTVLAAGANAGFLVIRGVGLWRSTSAITSVTIYCTDRGSASTPYVSGSRFSLYGIKAA